MSRLLPLALLLLQGLAALGIARADTRGGPLARAEQLLFRASFERDTAQRFQLADQALALAEQAARELPRDPTAQLMRARALQVHEVDRPESCRQGTCERAVEALERAQALDPGGVWASRIAQELGLLHSKLGRFPEALVDYDRALSLVEGERRADRLDEIDRSVLLSNSAETLMAMGRVDQAIARD